MALLEPAIATILGHEGSTFVNNLATGEVSKYGVTLRTYQSILDASATPEVIQNMTAEDAAAFYGKYLGPLHIENISDQTLATKIADLGVNMGVGTITRIVQDSLVMLGHAVAVDGRMGVLTLAAINAEDATLLLAQIRELAEEHYRQIAAADPRLAPNLPGWLARLES